MYATKPQVVRRFPWQSQAEQTTDPPSATSLLSPWTWHCPVSLQFWKARHCLHLSVSVEDSHSSLPRHFSSWSQLNNFHEPFFFYFERVGHHLPLLSSSLGTLGLLSYGRILYFVLHKSETMQRRELVHVCTVSPEFKKKTNQPTNQWKTAKNPSNHKQNS